MKSTLLFCLFLLFALPAFGQGAPVANDDAYTTAEDRRLDVAAPGILGNDTNPNPVARRPVVISTTQFGVLKVNADGSIRYTPNANFFGIDTFTYATVPTMIVPEAFTVDPAQSSFSLTVQVNSPLGNDSGSAESSITGTAAADVTPNNAPFSEIHVTDLDLRVADPVAVMLDFGNNGTLTVSAAADALKLFLESAGEPAAVVGGAFSQTGNRLRGRGVVDLEATGTLKQLIEALIPTGEQTLDATETFDVNGTITQDGNTLTLTLPVNFSITETFSFPGINASISATLDGTIVATAQALPTQLSNEATVTIDVTPVNDAPVVTTTSLPAATQDEPYTAEVEAEDVEGDPLTFALERSPDWLSIEDHGDGTATLSGTPPPGAVGDNNITLAVSDGQAVARPRFTLVVQNVNDAPVAEPDAYQVDEDQTLTVEANGGVLANDTDADGDPLALSLVTAPEHGTLTLEDDGSFTYTPTPNFFGADTFTYEVSDGNGGSDQAQVTITVKSVNDPPVAVDDAYTAEQDLAFQVDAANGVLANDSDIDGDALRAVLGTGPTSGQLSLRNDGSFTYTPNAGFMGTDTFTYEARDPNGGKDEATVTITVAAPQDTDTDGVPDQVEDGAPNGGDGNQDGTPDSEQANVASLPNATDGSYVTFVSEEGTTLVDVTAIEAPAPLENVSFPLGAFVFTVEGLTPGATTTVTLYLSGGAAVTEYWKYGPTDDDPTDHWYAFAFNGTTGFELFTDRIELHIEDGGRGDHDGAADGSITDPGAPGVSSNQAPVATDDAVETDEDTAVEIDLVANDTDADNNTLTINQLTDASNGTVTLLTGGTVRYTPEAEFSGTDSFTYRVTDGRGATATATVTVTVNDVNDAPTAAEITSPEDGSTVLIAGDPTTAFTVEWNASTDVEGDPLRYTWQLSTDASFDEASLLVSTDVGAATQFETDYGTVADLLAAAGIDLGGEATLHHRVVTSDGQDETASAAAQVTLTRGAITATGQTSGIPATYVLEQNYPNPFNPETTIRYGLPETGPVRLEVFDTLGRLVRTLADGVQPAGMHEVVFSGEGLPSGIYVYRLRAGGAETTRTLILMK